MIRAAHLLLAAGVLCMWLAMAWLIPGMWLFIGAGLVAAAGALTRVKRRLDTRSNRVVRYPIGEEGTPDALDLPVTGFG